MLRSKNNIAELDYRITFQEKIVGANESNEDEETGWQNVDVSPVVWASKTDKSGNESYRADKLTDYQNTVFVVRYREDITPKNRILCGGIPYDIISIQQLSRKRFLSIETESGGEYVEAEPVVGAFSNGFSSGFSV